MPPKTRTSTQAVTKSSATGTGRKRGRDAPPPPTVPPPQKKNRRVGQQLANSMLDTAAPANLSNTEGLLDQLLNRVEAMSASFERRMDEMAKKIDILEQPQAVSGLDRLEGGGPFRQSTTSQDSPVDFLINAATTTATSSSPNVPTISSELTTPTMLSLPRTSNLPTSSTDHNTEPQELAEKLATTLSKPGETFPSSFSSRCPMGFDIDPKLKIKIWSGQFVEMAALKKGDTSHISVEWDTEGNQKLSVKKGKHEDLGIYDWRKAFDTFMTLIVAKEPQTAAHLIRHRSQVDELFTKYKGSAWSWYDKQYRKAVASPEIDIAWDKMDVLLYTEAIQMGQDFKSASPSTTRGTQNKQGRRRDDKSNQSVPKGFCFAHHTGKTCKFGQQCHFKHSCPKCEESHSASQCRKKQHNGKKATNTSKHGKAATLS